MFELGKIIAPLIVGIVGLFLIFRLRFFSTRDLGGRYLFLFGLITSVMALTWNWVSLIADYTSWFIPSAYAAIEIIQFSLICLGGLLMTAGLALYADFWQTRREDIDSREGKLSVLQNLQHDARQPYHLMELLNIAIKEILYHSDSQAAALFLVNRRRRQLVLTSSAGFSKQEIAGLEHYPIGKNAVSQAIELADPVISSDFSLLDSSGKAITTKYKSTLVLPMISGMEKVGAVVLLSVEPQAFSNSDVSFLMPVAEWLAEKIKSARLIRELSLANSGLEKERKLLGDLRIRLSEALQALGTKEATKAFCTAMVGMAQSDSVHLYSVRHGQLQIHGGSEPLFDLPENYKAALIDTLDKNKSLIVNQEATDESGQSRLILSSLICPVGSTKDQMAILLRKETGLFKADDEFIKRIDMFGQLAALLLGRNASDRMAITRRLGFEKILDLLRMDSPLGDIKPGDLFIREITDLLPKGGLALAINPSEEGGFEVGGSAGVDKSLFSELILPDGEGPLAEIAQNRQPQFVYGRNQISTELDRYDSVSRGALTRLFGENGLPIFMAVCPIGQPSQQMSIALLAMWEIEEAERDEWERLLTLASGLVSLRLTIDRISQFSQVGPDSLGETTNILNNSLSVILGSAELAVAEATLPVEVRHHLESIVNEAQKAGEQISQLGQRANIEEQPSESREIYLDTIISKTLTEQRISGNLHMVGGRPRELDLRLAEQRVALANPGEISELFEAALNRFAATAAEEDQITVSTYRRDDDMYLDISRHRKNFPPVKPIASFSRYISADESLKRRPSDVYLKHLIDGTGSYAIDDVSQAPAYLSFKFPVINGRIGFSAESAASKPSNFRILAIDDEAVILDLIMAMCQSLGCEVKTARSGEEGLAIIAESGQHPNSKIDLVLTDLAMPGLSGLDVARQIKVISPDLPVILVTGWEAELDSVPIKAAGIREILFKPFRIEQLTEVIQTAAAK